MLRIISFVVAAVAIAVGLLLSPIPRNLGLYRWIAKNINYPLFVGFYPANLDGPDSWGFKFEDLYSLDLSGQTALVTGGNSGVGYAIAQNLAKLGAKVTIACRNEQRCLAAADEIMKENDVKGTVSTGLLDTSRLTSVKSFASVFLQSHEKLDMLFLNAGIFSGGILGDGSAPLSEDGFELVFATNHVGHHLLYRLLEPLILQSSMPRVVLTSSRASFNTFNYKVATDLETLNDIPNAKDKVETIYGQSKLAQILWAQELTRRVPSVYANAACPGAVNTPIWGQTERHIPAVVYKIINYLRQNAMWSPNEGALTLLYLGVATEELREKGIRGKYFHPQSIEVEHPLAQDEELQRKLWDFSDELVSNHLTIHEEQVSEDHVEEAEMQAEARDAQNDPVPPEEINQKTLPQDEVQQEATQQE